MMRLKADFLEGPNTAIPVRPYPDHILFLASIGRPTMEPKEYQYGA
jgi:hypothetical protein